MTAVKITATIAWRLVFIRPLVWSTLLIENCQGIMHPSNRREQGLLNSFARAGTAGHALRRNARRFIAQIMQVHAIQRQKFLHNRFRRMLHLLDGSEKNHAAFVQKHQTGPQVSWPASCRA